MIMKRERRDRAQVPDLPSFIPSVPVFEGEETFDAANEGERFLARFSTAIQEQNWDVFADLFCNDCFWRDNLTITFDKRTPGGKQVVVKAWKELFSTRKPVIHITKQDYALSLGIGFTRLTPNLGSLYVPFGFTTDLPRMNCIGMAKLVLQDGAWKIWILATAGHSLQDQPFSQLPRTSPSLVSASQRGKTLAQGLPDVKGVFDAVVVGGSTSGVATTIMLESIRANVITFDNHDEPGGNWSQGGKAYVILHHTPRMMELPQYPIPAEFADELGGNDITKYISGAVEALQLPVFCGINAKNIIFAIGPIASAANPFTPSLADRKLSQGHVEHSTQYKDAQPYQGKNVVVVGASNSAHDIARSLAEGGAANVTLLQRGPTAFFEWEKIRPLIEGPFASPLDIDAADFLYFLTLPRGIARDFAKGAMHMIESSQVEFYTALESKGYSVERNRDFVTRTYDSRNGHFFMDRQKSLNFVLNDRIKVARGEARGYTVDGLVVHDFSQGESKVLKTDAVVLATGFETINMPQIWASTGFVDTNSAAVLENPCAMEIDTEGEMLAQSTNSGHPHLYYASHNVVTNRYCSKYIAMQIVADLRGEIPAKLSRTAI